MESIQLTTGDGHELTADLLMADVAETTDSPAGAPAGGAVVCHPHPRHGGDRFNPVVDAVFRHLPTAGWATMRFDFRTEFDQGVGERKDVIAALDALGARVDGPLVVVGYSFGAVVALSTRDDRIAAVVAIAPPLTMMDAEPQNRPTLVVCPQHDQFTDVHDAQAIVERWPDASLRVVESVDHFLVGRADHVATAAADWLAGLR